MNPVDERRLRQNWTRIKQEINVEAFVNRFVEMGIFSEEQMRNIMANTDGDVNMRGERFLGAVLQGGNKTYQTMCNILLENGDEKRNLELIKILEIVPNEGPGLSTPELRQSTTMSIASSDSCLSLNLGATADSEMGEKNDRMVSARAPWRAEITPHNELPDNDKDIDDYRPSTPAEAVQIAIQKASDGKNGAVNMDTLEQELVKIAPTIADLFSKIQTQTTTVVATSEIELKKIKDDNDRLRKTNRSLVEKLNSFQQKIIQLQLENKKLREVSDNEKVKQTQLEQKSSELELLKERLIEQKKALEQKERELDLQMQKVEQVIRDNEEQKLKLANLEQLHEDGMKDYEEQQYQISELQQEKEQQREQIEVLVEKQKMSEQLLYRFEERLLQLERPPPKKNRTRFGLSRPWMNGAMEKSHHVNVKLQPQFPTDWSSTGIKGGKGWSF